MNFEAIARNTSIGIILVGAALALIVVIFGVLVALYSQAFLTDTVGNPVVLVPVVLVFGMIVVPLAFGLIAALRALRIKSVRPVGPAWAFLLGFVAPYVLPTVEDVLIPCPPPAVACGVVGAAPWPLVLGCFVVFGLATFAAWTEVSTRDGPVEAPLSDISRHVSTVLALGAGALLLWLLSDAIPRDAEHAAWASRIAAEGGGVDIVAGPTELMTVTLALPVALAVGFAAFWRSRSLSLILWALLLGVIWMFSAQYIPAPGTFGWGYRSFAQQWGWGVLLITCCSGFLTVVRRTS